MKKTKLTMMLCVALCIVMAIGAQAQPGQRIPAEKKAEMRAGSMKNELGLNEKQYRKLCKLFKKTEKAREKAVQENMNQPMGGLGRMQPPVGGRPGQGDGFGMGPEHDPGQGMPPGNRQRPDGPRPKNGRMLEREGPLIWTRSRVC